MKVGDRVKLSRQFWLRHAPEIYREYKGRCGSVVEIMPIPPGFLPFNNINVLFDDGEETRFYEDELSKVRKEASK